MSEDNRSRVWTFCLYPDSAPEDWLKQLQDRHLQGVVSPLHDADLNGDGSEKKSHWHVYLKFDGKKSFAQVARISQDLLHGTIPQVVDSPEGLIRYFIHRDNPEKAQYRIEDLIPLGGLPVEKYFQPTASRASAVMQEIESFILDNGIDEYKDLLRYAFDFDDWLYVLHMYNCVSIHALLRSMRGKK